MALGKLPTAGPNDEFTTWNWLKKLQAWITGMFYPNISTTAATLTLSSNFFYPVDATAADVVVTLPLAKNSLGKMYYIKKTDFSTHKVTVTPSGSDQIDQAIAPTTILNYWGSCVGLISDGISQWYSLKEPQLRADYSDSSSFQNFIQSSIVDGSTVMTSYPNGTGITCINRLVGSSDVSLTNSQFLDVRIDGLVAVKFLSRKTGTATALPMIYQINGVTGLTLDAANTAAVNVVPGSAALATTATDGFMYQMTCAGTPTGTPTAYTGRTPVVIDTTNDLPYYYNTTWKSFVTHANFPFFRATGMTVPLAASFTGTMGTLATTTDQVGRLQVTKANAPTNMAMLYIAAPTAPYTMDICGCIHGATNAGDDSLIGAGRSDGTKIQVIWSGIAGVAANNTPLVCQKWNTTTGAVATAATSMAATTPSLVYLRIVDDNTNCNYYQSNNGKDYWLLFAEARNTFLTATRVGICFYYTKPAAGMGSGKFAVYDFTITAGVLGDAA